jgi:hypothetical protein
MRSHTEPHTEPENIESVLYIRSHTDSIFAYTESGTLGRYAVSLTQS